MKISGKSQCNGTWKQVAQPLDKILVFFEQGSCDVIDLNPVPVVLIHHSHVTLDNQTYSNIKLELSIFCAGEDNKLKNRKISFIRFIKQDRSGLWEQLICANNNVLEQGPDKIKSSANLNQADSCQISIIIILEVNK